MLFKRYTGCRLIYFSIIKDIKPAARRQATLSAFFVLPPFLAADAAAFSFALSFFSALATTINQKKRFRATVWPGDGTQFSVCREIKI